MKACDSLCLTEREIQVLTLLVLGECNKRIAIRLGISLRTVEFHLTNLYTKLAVSSRGQAVAVAIQLGQY